jgi:hypothetical protein
VSYRYAIYDTESNKFYPWWKNFIKFLDKFEIGSNEFIVERDRMLKTAGAQYVLNWKDDTKTLERTIEFADANSGLIFILKWS